MSRHLLALAVTTALATTLAGCGGSSGDSNSGTTTAGGTTTGTTTTGMTTGGATTGGATTGGATTGGSTTGGTPPAPSGSGAPDGSTKAGVYIGDFGFGPSYDQGVFVVDNDFELSGFALASDGSAKSVFGPLGATDTFQGTLNEYDHQASKGSSVESSFGVSADTASVIGPLGLTFNYGSSIEGSSARAVTLTVANGGQLMPATLATVEGTWRSDNQYGDCSAATGPQDICRLVTEMTFSGGTVTGSTYLANTTNDYTTYRNPIDGVVSEFGDVLLLNLNWGTPANQNRNTYRGMAYFTLDGTERLVYAVESDLDSASPRVLAAVMTRQP